jgi:hypothetical protein
MMKDENLEDLFYSERPDWDMRFVYFEGDPIYDTDCGSDVDQLYKEPHVEKFHEEGESERVDFEERSIHYPSCLDDFSHLGKFKWDVECSYFEGIQFMTLKMRVNI